MDPFAVLGLHPRASSEQVTAAYRRLAKRWHPDRGGGPEAAARMARINAAYDQLRAELRAHPPVDPEAPVRGRAAPTGSWLSPAVRRALGPELLRVLQRGEQVRLVVPAATWASPRTVLAVTDRRLLWLLDDAVAHRVRFLRYGAIARVQYRPSWPWRRRATLRVESQDGRRFTFAALRPEAAAAIAGHVRAAAPTT
jgi:hypothetical protein